MKKLFIITGEYSGDKHASDVVRELKKINSEIEIEAVGGENLQNAGAKLFCNHSKMSAMGFNAKIILNHVMLGKNIANYIKNVFKPDMVLFVDYGGFNLNLSKVLSGHGIKLYYYIPPQIWASRKWRIKTVKKNIDKVLTIFPFEKAMYEKEGIDAEFVGHPLLNQIPKPCNKSAFFEENNLDKDKKLISIFPGSRVFEVKNLLNLFLESAELLNKQFDNLQFVVCRAPSIKNNLIEPHVKKHKNLNIKILSEKNYELLSSSDALILASGTVALEAALYNTPMIIAYKGPWFLYFVYRIVRCIDKVCLVNIITGKDIVPEILQSNAKPEIISSYIKKILSDEAYRTSMIKETDKIRDLLNTSGAAVHAAQIITNNI